MINKLPLTQATSYVGTEYLGHHWVRVLQKPRARMDIHIDDKVRKKVGHLGHKVPSVVMKLTGIQKSLIGLSHLR